MHSHDGNDSLPQLWRNTIGVNPDVCLFVVSDNIRAEALDTESISSGAGWQVLKQITVYRAGKIRVTFDHLHSSEFGKVGLLKNDTALVEYNAGSYTSSTWNSESEDIDVNVGDEIQIAATIFTSESHSVRNLRLKWDTLRSEDIQAWT